MATGPGTGPGNEVNRVTTSRRSRRAGAALTAALLATLILAACAPTVRGSTAFSPLPVRPGDTLTVEAGGTLFLEREYSYADFSLREGDFGRRLWVPEGASAESADVRDVFALRRLDAPPSWDFGVERLRALRETRSSFGRATTTRSVVAVFRLRVPDNAPAGLYTIDGTLEAQTGARQELALRVRVP